MEATPAVSTFSTRVGAKRSEVRSTSVSSPVARTASLTVSLVQPNCVSRKAGVLFSRTTLCNEKAASRAVTGRPD